MKIILIVLFGFISSGALAIEIKPYPKANITIEQWENYYNSVKKEIGHSKREYPEHHLEIYQDDKTRSNIAFTQEGHPAHPAWVSRYVTEENGSINLSQIGYFAGKEEPFAELFQQYNLITDKIRKEMAEKIERNK